MTSSTGYGYHKSSRSNFEDQKIYDFGDKKIERTEKSEYSREFSENPYVTLRMVYGSDTKSLSNTIGFAYDHNPESTSRGSVYYSSVYKSGTFDRSDRSRGATTSWNGDYYFALPHNYMLMVTGSASYTRRHSNTYYSTENNGAIANNAREDAWYVRGMAAANKQYGQFNIGYDISAGNMGNNLDYRGSSPSHSSMRRTTLSTAPTVNVSIGNVDIYAQLLFNYHSIKINNETSDDFWVNPYLTFSWNPSRKLQTQLTLFRQMVSYNVSHRSPDIIKRTEIEWITGNPELKNYFNNNIMLTAQYSLSRLLSLGVSLQYSLCRNTATYGWDTATDTEGRPVMIQSYMNSGSFHTLTPTVNFTGRFLKRSLMATLRVQPAFYRFTGPQQFDKSTFTWNAGVTYYKSRFTIGAKYASGSRLYTSFMSTVMPQSYNIFAGYSYKNLIVRVYAINFLSDTWKGARNVTHGAIFYNRLQNYYPAAHRNFMLSVTYSLSYGKKVNADEALKRVESTQSGLLK